MTITLDPPVTAVRRPGWLLVATLPAYAAYLAVAVTTIAQQAHSSADLTPTEIDELGVAWMAVHVLWIVPPLLAVIGLVGVARSVPGRLTRLVPALAVVTVALLAAYLLFNVLAFTSDATTWGESPLYSWSPLASLFAGWFGVHLATLIVVAALVQARIARRAVLVVGVLYALYVVFEILAYLPVLFGPTTFASFMGGLPPFLLGLLWAALGSALLKSRITSEG